MGIYIKLKQYYRYRRQWKKHKSRKARGVLVKNALLQSEFYSQFIKKGDIVFDIGANIGDKTDIFLRLGAKVVAVEPQESCWRVLKRRFKKQHVSIVTHALSAERGNVTMFLDKSPTISSISKDWISAVKKSGRFSTHKWSDKITVETTTMDDLIAQYGKPAFCKIDVEGAELEVLKGLNQSINVLSFEFIPEQTDFSLKCIERLSSFGETEFNYYLGEAENFALPNWVTADKIETIMEQMDKDPKDVGDIYVRFTTA